MPPCMNGQTYALQHEILGSCVALTGQKARPGFPTLEGSKPGPRGQTTLLMICFFQGLRPGSLSGNRHTLLRLQSSSLRVACKILLQPERLLLG